MDFSNNGRHSLASLCGLPVFLFDLDGTLRFTRPSWDGTMLDFAVSLGAADSPEQRKKTARWVHYYWAQSPELLEDIRVYPGVDDPFWVNYARRKLHMFGCSTEQAHALAPQVQQHMAEQFKAEDYIPPETYVTLRTLKSAGVRLGLVTNRTNPVDEYLAQCGLGEFFEITVVAGQVGSWKPERRIFETALQGIGCAAHEAVYVGDNYYADILGARAAGVAPVILDPLELFPEADCVMIRSLDELVAVV